MESRIRVKIGEVEIEYEGSEAFIESQLLSLVSQVATVYREHDLGVTPMGPASTAREPLPTPAGVTLTTSSIASRLNSKTGPDLLIAAAAHLTLARGQMSFTRQELLREMRSATPYYRTSYSANLTSSLGRVVKAGTLVESAKDTYALSASKRQELEKSLADYGSA